LEAAASSCPEKQGTMDGNIPTPRGHECTVVKNIG